MVALLVAMACDVDTSATWIDQSPACPAEPYAWADDLMSYVADGPGDGTFSLDPVGDARASVSGSYDPSSGEFAYDVEYADGYYLVSNEVTDGFGTVWHNGDLDIEFESRITDKLEDSGRTAWRVKRVGCKETWYTWDPSADSPDYLEAEGTYRSDAFEWAYKGLEGDYFGTRFADGSSTDRYENGDSYTETVYNLDGTREATFRSESTYVYKGEERCAFDGQCEQDYTISEDGEELCEVHAEWEYDGDGVQEFDCDGENFECEYDQKNDGSCEYTCSDGSEGDC